MADGSIKINTKIQDDDLKQQIAGLKTEIGRGMQSAVRVANRALAGMAAGVAAVGAASVKFAQATDRIDKMSQQLQLSRAGFQELDFVLSQSGVSIDGMQMGMRRLREAIVEAGDSTSGAADIFRELGVAVTDVDGTFRSQESVMFDALDALQQMEAGVERADMAYELFGRNAQELEPLLNANSGSIDELRARANDLGIVLDDSLIDSGVRLTDILDELKRMGNALLSEGIAPIIPAINDAADGFASWATEGDRLKNIITGLVSTIRAGFESGIIPAMAGAAVAIKGASVAMAAFNAVAAANPLGIVAAAAAALVVALNRVKNHIDAEHEMHLADQYGEIRDSVSLTADELSRFDKQLTAIGNSRATVEGMASMIGDIVADYGLSAEQAQALVGANDLISDEVAEQLDIQRQLRIEKERAALATFNDLRNTGEAMRRMDDLYIRHEQLAQERAADRRARAAADRRAEQSAAILGDITERLVRLDNLRAEGAIDEVEWLEDKLQLREQMIDKIKQEAVEGRITEEQAATMIAAQRIEVERYETALEVLNEQLRETADSLDSVDDSGESAVASVGELVEGWRRQADEGGDRLAEESGQTASDMIGMFAMRLKDGAHQAMTAAAGFSEQIGVAMSGGLGIAIQIIRGAWDLLMALFRFDPKKALEDLDEFLTSITDFFMTTLGSLPLFFDAGVEMISEMIDGLIENLPSIVKTIQNVVLHILDSIIENAPALIHGAATLVTEMIVGLVSMIPQIITAARTIVMAIQMAIMENYPLITGAIIRMLPDLIAAFILIVPDLIGAFVSSIPQIVKAFLLLIPAIIEALIVAIPAIGFAVLQAITELIGGLITGIVPFFKNLGLAIWDGLIIGIRDAAVNGASRVAEIFNNFIQSVKDLFGIASPSTVFASMGGNIVQGLINGIRGVGAGLWGAVKGVFTGLWDSISGVFSKAAEFGGSIISGIGAGIVGAKNVLTSAVTGVSGAVGGVFKGAASKISSGVSSAASAIKSGAGSAIDKAKSALSNLKFWDIGTPWIEQDHVAMVHQGERIVPKSFNQDIMAGNTLMLSPEAMAKMVAGVRQASGMGSSMVAGQAAAAGGNVVQLHAYMDGRIDISGEQIGRVAFEYLDEQAGVAFGN